MCGRYTHLLKWSEIVALYRVTQPEPPAGWSPRYNLAPTQDAPVVRLNAQSGEPECVMLKWGLVPFWANDPKVGYSTINARAESVRTKPAFREAFKHRRCIVPATGFYEWRAEGGKGKQPYHVRRADGQPMALAGLWERWHRGDVQPIESFTIVCCAASEQVKPLHDRMPVILDEQQTDLWLDPHADPDRLESFLTCYPGELVMEPVSKAVNNARNDGPELLRVPPPVQGRLGL